MSSLAVADATVTATLSSRDEPSSANTPIRHRVGEVVRRDRAALFDVTHHDLLAGVVELRGQALDVGPAGDRRCHLVAVDHRRHVGAEPVWFATANLNAVSAFADDAASPPHAASAASTNILMSSTVLLLDALRACFANTMRSAQLPDDN